MPDINIDHHISNTRFARLNFVDPDSPATAQMIAEHLDDWDLSWTPEIAQALLTGILTDTLGLKIRSVTPQTLRTAAMLMEQGADLAELHRKALQQRSFQAGRYWGAGLSALELRGKIVTTALTLEARAEAGYAGNDDADLVNILSGIREAPVAVLFVEQAGRNHPSGPRVKVSWRAQDDTDVSQIAAQFGGGGHRAASGAEIDGELELVRKTVLDATAAAL